MELYHFYPVCDLQAFNHLLKGKIIFKDPKNLKEGVKLFETLLGSSFEIEKIESLNYSLLFNIINYS